MEPLAFSILKNLSRSVVSDAKTGNCVGVEFPFQFAVLRHLCGAWERDAKRANAPFSFCFSMI